MLTVTTYVHSAKQMTNVIMAEKLRLLQDLATEANVMTRIKAFGLMSTTVLDMRHSGIGPGLLINVTIMWRVPRSKMSSST